MIDPFGFLDFVKREDHIPTRQKLARLALNLYFADSGHCFELAELRTLSPRTRGISMAAISWAHGQYPIETPCAYLVGEENILSEHLRTKLLVLAKDTSS